MATCLVMDYEGFCPCCSITDDILTTFAELLTPENPNPCAHVIATQYGRAIVQAWYRVAKEYSHPGADFTLTYNDNFIVVEEPV